MSYPYNYMNEVLENSKCICGHTTRAHTSNVTLMISNSCVGCNCNQFYLEESL